MAGTPRFKIFNPQKQYIAACKHLEDAAALAALNGNGATIRDGHSLVVWKEGFEEFSAAESYDRVAEIAWERIKTDNLKCFTKQYGADTSKWPEFARAYAQANNG